MTLPRAFPTKQAMLQRLKPRQLMLLIALDGRRSLRRAAAELNMTQSVATRLLHDLEATLGLELFERHRRGLVPNRYAEIMIRHARGMLASVDRAHEELTVAAAGGAGRVVIGAVLSAIPYLVARAVLELKAQQPQLAVAVEVATSDMLMTMLGRGELDLLLGRPIEAEEGHAFAYERLADEPLAIAARVGHPLCSRTGVTLRDLLDWPWVLMPPRTPMRRVLAPLFHAHGIDRPRNIVETSSMIMTTALLQDSDMVAVLPEDVIRHHLERGLLARLPIPLPPVMGAYGIITRRDHAMTPAGLAFLQCLRAAQREASSQRNAAAAPESSS